MFPSEKRVSTLKNATKQVHMLEYTCHQKNGRLAMKSARDRDPICKEGFIPTNTTRNEADMLSFPEHGDL